MRLWKGGNRSNWFKKHAVNHKETIYHRQQCLLNAATMAKHLIFFHGGVVHKTDVIVHVEAEKRPWRQTDEDQSSPGRDNVEKLSCYSFSCSHQICLWLWSRWSRKNCDAERQKQVEEFKKKATQLAALPGWTRWCALTCGMIRSSLMYMSCSTPADLQRDEPVSLLHFNIQTLTGRRARARRHI